MRYIFPHKKTSNSKTLSVLHGYLVFTVTFFFIFTIKSTQLRLLLGVIYSRCYGRVHCRGRITLFRMQAAADGLLQGLNLLYGRRRLSNGAYETSLLNQMKQSYGFATQLIGFLSKIHLSFSHLQHAFTLSRYPLVHTGVCLTSV